MTLENYKVQHLIAAGGYAKVYQAVDKQKNECVALKFIDKVRPGDPTHLDDVRAEVDIFRTLEHPNICKFYEVIETADQFVIAMELLAGGTLLDYFNSHELTDQEIGNFFSQLLSAMIYLRSCNVCHRDLRLDNICLDGRRNVKVIDFGFSCRYDPGLVMDTLCGCPEYCAPEMLQGLTYTAAVDVWSAGVILYTLAVGELPFSAETREETTDLVLDTEPEYPETIRPDLVNLIKGLLEKDPAKRLRLEQIEEHSWIKGLREKEKPADSARKTAGAVARSETPPKGFWQWLKSKTQGKTWA
jgi:serine/threonine protein kinase